MNWHNMSAAQTVEALKSNSERGLSAVRAKQLAEKYGENRLAQKKPRGILRQFLAQFSDFMVLILLAASALSFGASLLEGSAAYADPLMILGIVVLNAVIGVAQERRAEKSLAALKKLSAPTALVLRDGALRSLPAVQLVPGDIIELRTGGLVPADARLLSGSGLRVQESALTGESVPSGKNAALALAADCAPADRKNMLFSSTVIAAGHGRAIVTETGMQTQLGRIAHLLNEEEAPPTPLQVRLAKVGRVLGLSALGICVLIFLLGILRRAALLDSFLLSVSLAVAAIPEGLPAIVTVVLSLGVQRMAKRNAVVRHLPAVETLGAATVICSDKTGTLTQNKMTVTAYRVPGDRVVTQQEKEWLLTLAALCNNAVFGGGEKKRLGKAQKNSVQGEPTEAALLTAADEILDLPTLAEKYPRLAETPFSSERKCMSTLHRSGAGYLLAVKGAPDVLLPRCNQVQGGGTLTEAGHAAILRQNEVMAADALRVIAVAYRAAASATDTAEENLIFCGLIGLQDPPRREVPAAVRVCRQAGITPVMITGDHAVTASAVAREVGILDEGDSVLTGKALDALSQAELEKQIDRCRVFARVTPTHKVRIVKAFRARGEVVAMTGDGVNDAPALKAADIGCAMGKSGTEVAKSAADMILTDDNFATIVQAVAQGRGIYDNIKKAVHFLLSCNIGEILLIFVSSLLGMPPPLMPIQLLWVNLVTDSLPAMALGVERTEKDIMRRKPVPPGQSFFAGGAGLDILLEGILIGLLALGAFLLGLGRFGSPAVGRTMCFAVLSLSELCHTMNMRSRKSIFQAGLFGNRKLTLSVLLCAALQIAVITLPPLMPIFGTAALNAAQWGAVAGLSIAPVLVMEVVKAVGRRSE